MNHIIGIGDNVVDKYLDMGKMFPGGNTLNVSVLAKRYGAETAYIGRIGNDLEGEYILSTLKKERVDISRIRIVDGINAYANIELIDGDRRFVGNDRGVSRNIKLTKEDLDYIKNYKIIHTSIYSGTEDLLPLFKRMNKLVSFDFSNTYNNEDLNKILPYVDYVFFSASEKSDLEIQEFQNMAYKKGTKLVLVTRGSKGASLYYKYEYYQQDIIPTNVIDTLGAGDGFIARVLVGLASNEDIKHTLQNAAKEAAIICTYNGALGYGINIKNRRQIKNEFIKRNITFY